jgi:hypothetical protein
MNSAFRLPIALDCSGVRVTQTQGERPCPSPHTIDDVATHIAKMVVPGAPIYCEFKEMRGDHRVAVLKNPTGSLILEQRNERRGFGYYVVTWYPKRRAEGTLVGTIVKPDSRQ